MGEFHFLQSHPNHTFSEEDKTDYSEQDKYFIQCLKTMENIMDIDAYIIDYVNKRIIYATKGCAVYLGKEVNANGSFGMEHLDSLLIPEEVPGITVVNSKVHDFFYSLPKERRLKFYFTQSYKMRVRSGNTVLVNHRGSILSLTEKGALRLILCVLNLPTNEKVGNAFIKMTDTNMVYEFMPTSQKFVEVKTQKLTPKTNMILKLASNGKTETEIANQLGISVNTVKYHKKQIFSRLEVKNIAEAIQWANNQKRMITR